MGAQSEENKGVELTGGGGNAGRWRESVGGRKFSSREDFDHTVWDVRLVVENPVVGQFPIAPLTGA